MASETITQNDLREILSRTIGSVPSEYRKLLWTNPNPTASFSAQTISLDLSNYDAVDVEFRHWTNKDCRVTSRNELNEGEGVGIGTSTDAASYGNYRRGFKMYTNGVQFWGGTSNANVDNNSTIPVRIWGIKYERVAPPQLETPIIQTLTVTAQTDANGYFHLPTSLNDVIPIWAEVSGRPTGLRPCFLTNGYTETERYGLRFKAWNDVVTNTSTTITVTIYYIKLVN